MIDHEELEFEIVRPIESHARLIMEWRNDPVTLQNSFHQTPKEWNSFWIEFQKDYFVTPNTPCLFLRHNGQRITFLRFRDVASPLHHGRKTTEVSINVPKAMRGKGYGKASLIAIRRWLQEQGVDDLYAEVKEDNEISQKLFLAAEYKEIGKGTRSGEEGGHDVPIRKYLCSLSQEIEPTSKVFIIAEAGSNWKVEGNPHDSTMARTLIDVAADAGADAVKFQVFHPDSVYVANAGKSSYLKEAGIEEDINAIFKDLAMPYEMIQELAEHCRERQIEFMASSFSPEDFEAVDPYVSRHKIASYEITHAKLIELTAKANKPLILSTGAATIEEIEWAIDAFHSYGGTDITLLQCTAKYPAENDQMNLRAISWLRRRFKVNVGLSDHSRDPLTAPISAVSLGATVIEKHFTLANDLPGPDHAFAITPDELRALVKGVRNAEEMRGSGIKIVLPCEEELRNFAQRRIQVTRNIPKGETFREGENIAILRPGEQPSGIHPKYLEAIEGKTSTRDLSLGEGVVFGDWE